jgi:hypothetical protein
MHSKLPDVRSTAAELLMCDGPEGTEDEEKQF